MISNFTLDEHLCYIHKLMERAVNTLVNAQDSLYKYELSDGAYIVASNLLNIANATYVELLRYEHENRLEHLQTSEFMNALDLSFNIFLNIISEKDDNLSDLEGAVTSLESEWKEINEYITERLTEQVR